MTVRSRNMDKIGLKIPEHWNPFVASIEVRDEEYDDEAVDWFKVAHHRCVIKYIMSIPANEHNITARKKKKSYMFRLKLLANISPNYKNFRYSAEILSLHLKLWVSGSVIAYKFVTFGPEISVQMCAMQRALYNIHHTTCAFRGTEVAFKSNLMWVLYCFSRLYWDYYVGVYGNTFFASVRSHSSRMHVPHNYSLCLCKKCVMTDYFRNQDLSYLTHQRNAMKNGRPMNYFLQSRREIARNVRPYTRVRRRKYEYCGLEGT
jgi:hypothetical protein